MIAIATNSMNPAYGRGDAIIYEKLKPEEIEVGDILVFKKDNVIITHRVTKKWISNDIYHFNTKGDNNETIDRSPIKFNQIQGKEKEKEENNDSFISEKENKIDQKLNFQ